MPFQVIYDTETRDILVIDPQPDPVSGEVVLPTGRETALATLNNPERAKFNTAWARFKLAAGDSSIDVDEVGPPPPDPVEVEKDASRTDFVSKSDAADTRLTEIITLTASGAPTGPQLRDALHDVAVIVKRVVRHVKAQAT